MYGKVDLNQKPIVAALRKKGASVFVASSVGHGFPDLVVGYNGRNYLMEVKSKRGKLTDPQVAFECEWHGTVKIVRTVSEALDALN